jgi:hypothetical protein
VRAHLYVCMPVHRGVWSALAAYKMVYVTCWAVRSLQILRFVNLLIQVTICHAAPHAQQQQAQVCTASFTQAHTKQRVD